jgi:hypothetical protein
MSTKIDLEVTTSRLLEALEYTGFIRVGDTESYKLPQYSVPVPLKISIARAEALRESPSRRWQERMMKAVWIHCRGLRGMISESLSCRWL